MALYSWYKNHYTQQKDHSEIDSNSLKNKQITNYNNWPIAQITLKEEHQATITKVNHDDFFTIKKIAWQNLFFENK